MRIERLYLKAYGSFTERRLDFAGTADFHLLYGPNEAGKSTTLRALAGLLFGIEERTPDNFLHPHGQLRIGAVLRAADGARLALMRRKARKHSLFALDEATGAELGDRPLAEEALARLLGGLDQGLYRALFGLDLAGLTEGSQALLAGKGEIGQSLFEAAAGLAGLHRIKEQLDSEAGRLFRPRASTSALHGALKELEDKRRLVRDASVRSHAWEAADRARRQAETLQAEAKRQLADLREEERRLSRIAANLPLAAERREKRAELETLAGVPLLPEESGAERVEAEAQLRGALDTQREAEAEIARLELARAGLEVRRPLLERAAAIERLHHGAPGWRGAVERLPRIRRDAAAAGAEIAARLAGIAPELAAADPAAARALVPARTLIARLQTLADEHASHHAEARESAERRRTIAAALAGLRAELAERPEPPSLDGLETARERAAAHGDLAAQLARQDREIAALEAALAREAAPLWRGTPAELAALPVPLAATLREFEEGYRRLAHDSNKKEERDAELVEHIAAREGELRALAAAGEIATFDQVRAARSQRDEGWSRVRRAYVDRTEDPARPAAEYSPGANLADAFEADLREADRLADLLRADTGRAATFEVTRKRIADMAQARAVLAGEREALAAERRALDVRWASVAASLGQPELSPAAAIEWLGKRALWLEKYAQLGALRRAREETAANLAAALDGLRQALGAAGLPEPAAGETLASALDRTRAALDAARRAATARTALSEKIAGEERALRDIAARETDLAAAGAEWRRLWSQAVTALRLPAEALPAEARARIDELQALEKSLDHWAELRREAEGEERTAAGFEAALAELARAVDEPLAGREADQAIAGLYEALAAAREAERRLRQLDDDLAREAARLRKARLDEALRRERLAELLARAGVDSLAELPGVEADAARKRRLAERLAEIDEQLVRSAGRPLAEVLAEVDGRELAATAARLAELESAVAVAEADVQDATDQHGEARRAFAAIDGGDAAARAQQDAEELLARIAGQARSYARARLAEAVLARVVQNYRERHQGPILRRAGEIFAAITLGAFSGLAVDYEQDALVLLGQRSSGARVGVAGMSQGSRDQLFLALRIAAIEEHLRQREAIPLVIDDLLVQFDDARAAATLQVLAELARHTQVLFFTHHGHLCELAERHLAPESWRRHDLESAALAVP